MGRIKTTSLLSRLAWVSLLLLLLIAIPVLNKYRGGEMLKMHACVLTSSKLAAADDSVLMFGSSRTITELDE